MGTTLLTCGNKLVSCGNNFLTCWNDFLTCGNDLLTCGNDFLSCGNNLLSCGNEIKKLQEISSMSLPGLRSFPPILCYFVFFCISPVKFNVSCYVTVPFLYLFFSKLRPLPSPFLVTPPPILILCCGKTVARGI